MELKIALITFLVLLVVIAVFAIMYRIEHFKNEKLKKEKSRIESMYESACTEIEQLRVADEIKKKNRKEADEKINDLLSGKLSADDILPKRKSRL